MTNQGQILDMTVQRHLPRVCLSANHSVSNFVSATLGLDMHHILWTFLRLVFGFQTGGPTHRSLVRQNQVTTSNPIRPSVNDSRRDSSTLVKYHVLGIKGSHLPLHKVANLTL